MRCPACKEESFPKRKVQTDGWKVVGEVEVCALCGAEWKKSAPAEKGKENRSASPSRSRLAALLGEDLPEKTVLAGVDDRKFCRNCRYFIVHPFKMVCALSDEETDPMGECEKFTPKD